MYWTCSSRGELWLFFNNNRCLTDVVWDLFLVVKSVLSADGTATVDCAQVILRESFPTAIPGTTTSTEPPLTQIEGVAWS